MKLLIAIAGFIILFATLWEAFETIILPRRVTRPFRLVRIFYRVTWTGWAAANRLIRSKKLRDAQLSYYGPLSLLGLFVTWAILLVLAFAMLQWAAGSAINAPGETPTFRTDFYLSGTTFFTLGLGDVTPRTTLAKATYSVTCGRRSALASTPIRQSFGRRSFCTLVQASGFMVTLLPYCVSCQVMGE
jgi:hypothetical protein